MKMTLAERTRPEDGGIVWHDCWNAFECLGCGDFEEIRQRALRTPAKLAELKELLVVEHTECWKFADPKMALDARRYRKEKTRRDNLKARAAGSLDRMSVATQRESWRGR